MGVYSTQSLRLLFLSSLIGLPWLIWLFFNWPSRRRIGIPLYFDYSQPNPSANVTFSAPYGVYDLDIEMTVPTSPDNQKLGQFMLNTQILNNNKLYFHSNRPALLKYSSIMSFWIRDVIYCLLDLFQFSSQTNIETFSLGKKITFKYSNYIAKIIIDKKNIQIYNSVLWIRQRSISWMRLFFYICMLCLYLLFILINGFYLIRLYFRSHFGSHIQIKRRFGHRRKFMSD